MAALAVRKENKTLRVFALLLTVLSIGCATGVLDNYEHEHSYHCRIDNPDLDNLWDTSDENGNGLIDEGETAGPVFDFAALAGEFGGDDSITAITSSSINASTNSVPQSSPQTSTIGSWGVHVNFTTPAGYLQGFGEYAVGESTETVPAESVTYVSSVNLVSGNGVNDDLDGDTSGVLFVLVDTDRDGIPDTEVVTDYDFDDLHTFNVSFNRILADPHTESHGMQVVSRHRISAKQPELGKAAQALELSYGARYLRLTEYFAFEGSGGFLGETTVDMTYDNRLVGPQAAVHWHRNHRDWTVSAGSTLMLGYNFAEAYQLGVVGEALSPGLPNHSLRGTAHRFVAKREHEELASIAEISARASYPLRRDVKLNFGYRALYISDLRHAGESVDWSLPSFGILDNGSSGAWLEGLHASVEWRR
ncbi:MAG: hypothetical protein AAGD11_14410 [Planctomycetota bacterium]